MSTRTIEIAVGFFVALGFAALLMLAMQVSNLNSIASSGGYTISAKFSNVGGLKVKSPVKMAGVRIGRVTDVKFDQKTYEAIVSMKIDSRYQKIPTDTSASILTSGLLGEQYIGLEAGAEEEYLTEGKSLFLTQPAVVLEQLIGKFLTMQSSTSSN